MGVIRSSGKAALWTVEHIPIVGIPFRIVHGGYKVANKGYDMGKRVTRNAIYKGKTVMRRF